MLQQDVADGKAALEQLNAARDKAQEDVQQAKAQATDLAQQVSAATADLAQRQHDLADVEAARQAADVAATASAAKLAAAVVAQQAAQAAAQQAQDAQAGVEKQLADLHAQLDQAAQQKEAADQALAAVQQQSDAAKQALADATAAHDKAQADLQQAQQQLAGVQQQLGDADKALALAHLRSDFFAKLRGALAGKPGITVGDDHAVLSTEALFAGNGAAVSTSGRAQLQLVATALKDATASLPADAPWQLEVAGYPDRHPPGPAGKPPVPNFDYPAPRAVNLAKVLVADGLPVDRIAATALGEPGPVDPAEPTTTKGHRIELRLTGR